MFTATIQVSLQYACDIPFQGKPVFIGNFTLQIGATRPKAASDKKDGISRNLIGCLATDCLQLFLMVLDFLVSNPAGYLGVQRLLQAFDAWHGERHNMLNFLLNVSKIPTSQAVLLRNPTRS